jgi:hypothetical protein
MTLSTGELPELMEGQYFVVQVSLTFRSNGWRVRHQETKVEAWVTTHDGKGTVELKAPGNIPCCMVRLRLS